MKLHRLHRRIPWPKIDVYGSHTRGDIKMLTVDDLDRLMIKASSARTWSAVGRPDWFRRNRESIRSLTLTVWGLEGRSVYRCLVAARLDDDAKCSFTLDVSVDDFDRLPDVTMNDLVSFAHRHLTGFPPLELDPDQKEAWRRHGYSID